jgi:hypothetical protein
LGVLGRYEKEIAPELQQAAQQLEAEADDLKQLAPTE